MAWVSATRHDCRTVPPWPHPSRPLHGTRTCVLAGFLLGTRQTLLETLDGGRTWNARSIDSARDEGFNYRFNSISFSGKEGWIVGKPAILLHTSDAGASWERVPLSAKLPGARWCRNVRLCTSRRLWPGAVGKHTLLKPRVSQCKADRKSVV